MDDVSRETPPAPDVARGVFAARLPQAIRYAELLTSEGTLRGLIGPREVPRLWQRHLLNCAVVADAIEADATVADIGSGAGLPGLVLAIRRPDLRVTLIEPMLRRTTFLDEVAGELGLDNVEVARGRAEEFHGTRTFDVVTSRAVAPLAKLARWSMPLVRGGGSMLAMKGSSAAAELSEAQRDLRKAGARSWRVESVGDGVVDDPVTLVRVERSGGRGE